MSDKIETSKQYKICTCVYIYKANDVKNVAMPPPFMTVT